MSAGISQCAYINLHIIDLKLNLFLQAMNQAEALSSVNYRILKTISLNHQLYIIDVAYSNRGTVYFSFTNISHQTNSVHKMFFSSNISFYSSLRFLYTVDIWKQNGIYLQYQNNIYINVFPLEHSCVVHFQFFQVFEMTI